MIARSKTAVRAGIRTEPLLFRRNHRNSGRVLVSYRAVLHGRAFRPTIGAGADTLALAMSEDAFQGDAQFTVTVDGKQIGGTQTVTASHAAGQTQLLDVLGTFGAGAHTASLNFLNDLYAPGVGDRNLYLDSASIDGKATPAAHLTLMSVGAQSFAFVGVPHP